MIQLVIELILHLIKYFSTWVWVWLWLSYQRSAVRNTVMLVCLTSILCQQLSHYHIDVIAHDMNSQNRYLTENCLSNNVEASGITKICTDDCLCMPSLPLPADHNIIKSWALPVFLSLCEHLIHSVERQGGKTLLNAINKTRMDASIKHYWGSKQNAIRAISDQIKRCADHCKFVWECRPVCLNRLPT